MGIAFPSFVASVPFLCHDDRRISRDFCSGVAFMSIHFAAGLSGDGVFSSWSVPDDSEMEVSHSNWIFVRSIFGFFLGVIFPDGFVCCCRCVFGSLFSCFGLCGRFGLLLKVLNSICGPKAFRFSDY